MSAIEANKAAQNQSWGAWVGSFWGGSAEPEPQQQQEEGQQEHSEILISRESLEESESVLIEDAVPVDETYNNKLSLEGQETQAWLEQIVDGEPAEARQLVNPYEQIRR